MFTIQTELEVLYGTPSTLTGLGRQTEIPLYVLREVTVYEHDTAKLFKVLLLQ